METTKAMREPKSTCIHDQMTHNTKNGILVLDDAIMPLDREENLYPKVREDPRPTSRINGSISKFTKYFFSLEGDSNSRKHYPANEESGDSTSHHCGSSNSLPIYFSDSEDYTTFYDCMDAESEESYDRGKVMAMSIDGCGIRRKLRQRKNHRESTEDVGRNETKNSSSIIYDNEEKKITEDNEGSCFSSEDYDDSIFSIATGNDSDVYMDASGGDDGLDDILVDISAAIDIDHDEEKSEEGGNTTAAPNDVDVQTEVSDLSQFHEFNEVLEYTKLKAERIEAFFFNNGMTVALGCLFLATNVIVAAHAAHQFTASGGFSTDNDILRVTLPIARAGGRLVTFNCAWLLVTACKHLWTLIRTHVVPIVPIGFPIDDVMPKYHRFFALWIIVSGCIIHAFPQILNYGTGAIKIDDGSKIWTFGNGFATRQLLITGSLLTFVFVMFFLTTLKAFRKSAAGFRWFWIFHMGGVILAYPLLIIHGSCKGNPVFLYVAMAPLMLYLFDATMRRSKVTPSRILEWKTHSDENQRITELILECPPTFVYAPGQYAELKFKSISSYEWHPFTIASAPTSDIRYYDGQRVKVLIFFIKATGRWTEALFNFASAFDLSKATNDMEIFVRGPHGAPTMNFFDYKRIIVIGSGVGVAPLLSVWQYMVDQGHSTVPEKSPPAHLPKTMSQESCTLSPDDTFRTSRTYSFHDPPRDGNHSLETARRTTTFCSACSEAEAILESLTASIVLFGFFLTCETIVVVAQIFGCYAEVASMERAFASISLVVHTGAIAVSMFGNERATNYIRLPKFWIEAGIILVDASNLWLSGVVSRAFDFDDAATSTNRSTRWIVVLGGVTVLLHAVRVLHVFYTTLKPRTETTTRRPTKQKCRAVSSIQGIFINRHYSGMRFCFEQLLRQHPLEEDGLSSTFSLDFYGTQETNNEGVKSKVSLVDDSTSLASTSHPNFRFHQGRPDFESILRKAIQTASSQHDPTTQVGGESIGVFFCGSPAIAKSLRSIADQVNAQHRFVTKRRSSGARGKSCKLVVHIENY